MMDFIREILFGYFLGCVLCFAVLIHIFSGKNKVDMSSSDILSFIFIWPLTLYRFIRQIFISTERKYFCLDCDYKQKGNIRRSCDICGSETRLI